MTEISQEELSSNLYITILYPFRECRNIKIYTFERVSGTCGPSQIRTDLTDPADGPNGSIRISDLGP